MQQTVRVFISSPGDVEEERDKARRVIQKLQTQFRDVTLEPLLWEDLALPVTASFQETIEFVLEQRPIDIAIFILWSRLGSPLGTRVTKADGSVYRSGTEREFDLMLNAFKQSKTKRPVILAYTRDDEQSFRHKFQDLALSGDEVKQLFEQHELAKSFVSEQFHDAEGHNLRAYHSYREPTGFAQLLQKHLQNVLSEVVRAENSPRWTQAPYRSLNAFDVDHAPIFHGREEETTVALQKLLDQERAGRAFLVIVGASGSGKSSLAMAGVAASLQNSFDDTVEWKVAKFIPGTGGEGLFLHLARTIAEQIPSLLERPEAVADIANGLARDPALTTKVGITPALAAASKSAKRPISLLLILDQLEELWTDQRVTGDDRVRFLEAIESLSQSGVISCLATLRSDFYPQAQLIPAFLRMKSGDGQMDLVPPDIAALQKIICEPARMAGVSFEFDASTQRKLDELILKEAAKDPSVLPLLQYFLSELYDRRNEDTRELTLESYDALGGIEGAIAYRAGEVFDSLSKEVRGTLPDILPLLITVGVQGEDLAVRRWAEVSDLTSSPNRRTLVNALVESRFLVTDDKEKSVASFTHEAILRRWEKVSKWIEANQKYLRIRSGIEQNSQRWSVSNRDRSLLLSPGLALEEGKNLLQHSTLSSLDDRTKEYVLESVSIDRTRRRQKSILATLAILTLAAIGFLGYYESEARRLVGILLTADAADVPQVCEQIDFYRLRTNSLLRSVADGRPDANKSRTAKMETHAQIALAASHPQAYRVELTEKLLDDTDLFSSYEYVGVIGDTLQSPGVDLADELWAVFRDTSQANNRRFRAGLSLAKLDPDSSKWQGEDFEFISAELASINTIHHRLLWNYLAPIRKGLLEPLHMLTLDERQLDSHRIAATNAYGKFAAEDPIRLSELMCMPTTTSAQFEILFQALKMSSGGFQAVVSRLTQLAQQQPAVSALDEEQIDMGRSRASAAIALLRMGEYNKCFAALRVDDDPESLTQFLHYCRERGVKADELITAFDHISAAREPLSGDARRREDSVQYGILLALGEFSKDELSPEQLDKFSPQLIACYESDPSSAVHSACGWLLRKWGFDQEVAQVDQTPCAYDSSGERDWFVEELVTQRDDSKDPNQPEKTGFVTFIVFRPGEYSMGSTGERTLLQDEDEKSHRVQMTYPFAISDRELSWSQFQAAGTTLSKSPGKRAQEKLPEGYQVQANDPAIYVTWTEAAKYCRWLTDQVKGLEEQHFYPPSPSKPEDSWAYQLDQLGFRLPTEAEWERACRSGTSTTYSFGTDSTMLDRYGWYLENSGGQWQPVGTRRPNLRGVFDLHGNVAEWCHDWWSKTYYEDSSSNGIAIDPVGPPSPAGESQPRRINRGGSWSYPARTARTALRSAIDPRAVAHAIGFRLARTLPAETTEDSDK